MSYIFARTVVDAVFSVYMPSGDLPDAYHVEQDGRVWWERDGCAFPRELTKTRHADKFSRAVAGVMERARRAGGAR
jgi:hypothetical protein